MQTVLATVKRCITMEKQERLPLPAKPTRDARLDLIKAISICLVLIWHFRPVSILLESPSNTFAKNTDFIVDQLYLNFTLIAVPLFILTSVYLLFQKLDSGGSDYLLKRCQRLLQIFVFWLLVQFFVYYSVLQLRKVVKSDTLTVWPANDFTISQVLVGIEPSIPIIGDSVFYFLSVLLGLSVIAYLFIIFKPYPKFRDYLVNGSIVIGILYFELLAIAGQGIPYWRIDNFLIYVPLAYLLAKQNGRVSNRLNLFFYLGFLAFGFHDMLLRWHGYGIGLYSRVSIMCGALAVFTSCLRLRDWQAPNTVKFLSTFSLGIFAIHKYWQFILSLTALKVLETIGLPTHLFIISTTAIYVALVATLLTFITVRLLAWTPLKMFVK